MNPKLEPLITRLLQATNHEGVVGAVNEVRDHYDVEHVVYHSTNHAHEPYLALTYDEAWVNRYLTKDYARIDPVVQGSFRRFNPVDWKELDWSSKIARNFFAEAVDSGVGNQGLTVPIRGPGGQFALFTVSASKRDESWQSFSRETMSELLLVAHYINQRVLDLTETSAPPAAKPLSPREIDALSLIANGISRAGTAEKLGISEHTLRVYIESARLKLGAANTTHAVAMALTQGLIIL